MLNILKILYTTIFLSCLSLFSQSEPPEVTAQGESNLLSTDTTKYSD